MIDKEKRKENYTQFYKNNKISRDSFSKSPDGEPIDKCVCQFCRKNNHKILCDKSCCKSGLACLKFKRYNNNKKEVN